jgi:hypothetical protein
MGYGMAALVSAILVWLNVFYRSDVIRVGNRTELIRESEGVSLLTSVSTLAASLMVFTSLIGYAGILLNVRAFLAVYTLLLWVCLGFLVAPGYMTYKQRTFNLEGKINSQWSRTLGTGGRLRVQDAVSYTRQAQLIYSSVAAGTSRLTSKRQSRPCAMLGPTFQVVNQGTCESSVKYSKNGTSSPSCLSYPISSLSSRHYSAPII